MTTRIKINDAALRAEIDRHPGMKQVQLDVANEIMKRSMQNTPRGSHVSGPGRQPMFQTFFVRPFRNYYRTGSTSSFYHLIEYGSVNNRPYAPIRRAVQSLGAHGIHFKETPKR